MIPSFFTSRGNAQKHFQITFVTHLMLSTAQQSLFEYIWTSGGKEFVNFMSRRGKIRRRRRCSLWEDFSLFSDDIFRHHFFFSAVFSLGNAQAATHSQTSFALYLWTLATPN